MKTILEEWIEGKGNQMPVWFMRQAGRYLPEYQALRKKQGTFLDLCFSPELVTEITLMPLKRFDFDAAIIFSDILVIPHVLGQKVRFVEKEGPRLGAFSLENLDLEGLDSLKPVYEGIQMTRKNLAPEKSLFGFVGAPWTLSTYMIEGGTSKTFEKVKTYGFQYPDHFKKLLDILVKACSQSLIQQAAAGANLLQIFDTWAGVVPDCCFDQWVKEPLYRIIENVRQVSSVPIFIFLKGVHQKLETLCLENPGFQGMSLDSSTPLSWIRDTLQPHVVTQGNLDPYLLKVGGEACWREVDRIRETLSAGRHIFNLGHGILPETPLHHVERVLEKLKS